jgi:hypothetical protein
MVLPSYIGATVLSDEFIVTRRTSQFFSMERVIDVGSRPKPQFDHLSTTMMMRCAMRRSTDISFEWCVKIKPQEHRDEVTVTSYMKKSYIPLVDFGESSYSTTS